MGGEVVDDRCSLRGSGKDASVQIGDDLARGLEGAVLPGDRVAEIVASKVDAAGGLKQATVGGIGAATGTLRPSDPAALAEAGPAPVIGEGCLELGLVRRAVDLSSLGERALLALQRCQRTKSVGGG